MELLNIVYLNINLGSVKGKISKFSDKVANFYSYSTFFIILKHV